MIINHNIAALNTYRQLSNNNLQGSKALEKLSSGQRINKAGDDAAGLAISEKMRAQIRGLDQASRNAQDAISLIQTAEGGLNETHSILQRMRGLATQAASDTNVDIDREEIQKEINQLTSEINRIGNTTEFNTMKLLDGGTSRTANIRYSIETASMAEITPTGEVSAVDVVTNSVKASETAISAVTVTTDSVAAAGSPVGGISQPNETTGSVVAGIGDIQLFRVDTGSVKAANAGTIGDFEISQNSVLQGTGVMELTEIIAGDATHTATYGIEITDNFTAGDTITIGTQTFEAGTDFTVGATITETRDNIMAAIDAGGDTYVDGGTTYNLTDNDPSYDGGGYADNNLIIFTDAAGPQVDANAGAMNASAITQVAAQVGEYRFEIATNFAAGQTIEINGYSFTAAAGGGNTNTQFEIGATVVETAEKLRDAINAARIDGGDGQAALGGFNAATVGTGVYNDTITLTETAATGNDLAAVTKTDVAEVQGVYSFEIKDNFSVGDKITIDGQEFTAVEDDGVNVNTGTQFLIGGDEAATASNLAAAIDLNGTLSTKYDNAAVGSGAFGNNRITLTESVGQAEGINLASPTVDQVDEVQGEYTFSLVANFAVGEKITIGGQEFTAVASNGGADNTATTFEVGANTDATAANLKAAMEANATLDDHYSIALAGSDFTVIEKAGQASGSALTVSATSAVGEVRGDFKFAITSNFSDGDKITIGGVEFTAKTGGADTANGEFNIGADLGATTDNLIIALNDAGNATSARFTASKLTDNTDPLNPTYEIRLYEDNGAATGSNLTDPSLDLVQEVQSVYTFDVEANFADGDKLAINGTTLVAGDDFRWSRC
ncbi:flagellin [Desulfotomaculum arcticum]|uniref:Flagellin n=1 Tax=Desulfotruncus arcticus DSM 17038 TaxID=1121424 RepID=A0A1I2P486_9FIRM|nr:flagellin [Desulfotomaculum arcticum] [Desulfotruncus arcticus DSM 17038]